MAVAMRFEVVQLQEGVTLPKAVVIMQSAEKIFTFIFELSGWTPSCLEN